MKNPSKFMDKWSRNARLYETLKGMGLYVDPIHSKTGRIDHFIVSIGVPEIKRIS